VLASSHSDRGDEGASLLSDTTSDIESFHYLEKLPINRRSPSTCRSTIRSLFSALLPLFHFRFTFRFIRYLIAIAAAIIVFRHCPFMARDHRQGYNVPSPIKLPIGWKDQKTPGLSL
jgi:hypothetical protein